MTCQPYHHKHPRITLSLRTRSRTVGTLNLAVALRGRSCGWGTCERPRRTFIGFHRRLGNNRPPHHRGIELVLGRPDSERTLFRIPLGSGITTWRWSR